MNLPEFFQAALEASWQGSLVILLILLLRPLFGMRVPARWRSLLWTLALLRLLVPAFLLPPSPASLQNIKIVDRPFEQAARALDITTRPAETASERSQGPDENDPTPLAMSAKAPEPWPWWQIAAAVWIAGTVLTALWISVGTILLHGRLRRDSRDADPEVLAVWERCCSRVFPDDRRRLPLLLVQSSAVSSPALIGLLRPVLLIPRQGCEDLSPEDWEHIFLHELAHFRRRDHWTHALQLVALCLHWFNPLVWFGFRYLRADRELAADAWALRHLEGRGPVAYGRTLLKMLSAQSLRGQIPGQPNPLPRLVGIMEDGSQLKQRLRHIRDFAPRRFAGSIMGIGVALALAVVVIGRQMEKVNLKDYTGLSPAETLVTAARNGEVAVVREALDDGTDINAIADLHGKRTALSAAVTARQLETVRLLVERGANVNFKTENTDLPIVTVLKIGWRDCLDFLLAKGAVCEPELLAAARGETAAVQIYLAQAALAYGKVKTLAEIAAANGHRELFASLYDTLKQLPEQGDYSPFGHSTFVNAITNGHRGVIEELILRNPGLVPSDSVNRIAAAAQRIPGMREWLISKGMKVPEYNDGERLIDAAEREDLPGIRRLLAAGVDVNYRGESDWMPLCKAVVWGCPRAVKLLLENKADPNPPRYSYSTLELANTPEIADLLVAAGAKVKPEDIGYSLGQGSVKMVQWFLDHGVDATRMKSSEDDPQNLLFRARTAEVAELLIARGVPVNIKDKSGNTALRQALQRRDNPAKLVALLLKHGADPNERYSGGYTPLMSALDGATVDVLVAADADLHAINDRGNGVLATGGHSANPSRLEALIRHGLRLDAESGASQLMDAVILRQDLAGVKQLLAMGVDPNRGPLWNGHRGASPLAAAVSNGHFKIAEVLRAAGANDVGFLSEAAARGDLAKMKALLDAGAEVNEPTDSGYTPLFFAVQQGQSEAVQLLLDRGANVNLFTTYGLTAGGLARMQLSQIEYNHFSPIHRLDLPSAKVALDAIIAAIRAKKPDSNFRNEAGETGLMCSATSGTLLAWDFEKNGGNLNAQRPDGMTALMLAIVSQPKDAPREGQGSVEMADEKGKPGQRFSARGHVVKMLLECGADLTLRNQAGKSALDLARENGNAEILALLEGAAKR